MQFKSVLLLLVCTAVFCFFTNKPTQKWGKENNAPQVRLTKPTPRETLAWSDFVPYNITVNDTEDGNSAYDEIATNDVYLKIKFFADAAAAKAYKAVEEKGADPKPLALIKSSDCFNCHAMHNKVIGPSFEATAKKYPATATSISLIAKKISSGSEANSATEKMPPHPDIKPADVVEIVKWVLKAGADTTVDYLRGLDGSFRTRAAPKKSATGVYVLTASYTDHGAPPQQGRQVLLLNCK